MLLAVPEKQRAYFAGAREDRARGVLTAMPTDGRGSPDARARPQADLRGRLDPDDAAPRLVHLYPDARVHCPPDAQMQLNLAAFLLGVRRVRPGHFQRVGVGGTADEVRALKVLA